MNPKELLAQALRLSPEERAALAHELFQSLDPQVDDDADADIEAAWSEEIRRRVESLERGEVTTIPWAEVRRSLLRSLRRGATKD
jgi:putative addiction module component (TIGR02574 family)